jgi:hypothetical protein
MDTASANPVEASVSLYLSSVSEALPPLAFKKRHLNVLCWGFSMLKFLIKKYNFTSNFSHI